MIKATAVQVSDHFKLSWSAWCCFVSICRRLHSWPKVEELLTYSMKLTSSRLDMEFSAVHVTRMFITTFTSAHHLSLLWSRRTHSMPPHPTYWRSILISSHLSISLPSGLSLCFLHQKAVYTSPLPHTCQKNWQWIEISIVHVSIGAGIAQSV
jgi:hypothetical protein